MGASNTVELVVTVEVDRANRSIRTVNASFAGMESSVARATAGATRSLNGLEQSAARTSASIRNHFSGIARAIAGLGVAALAKQTVTIAADFERERLGLEAFLGSADKAKR